MEELDGLILPGFVPTVLNPWLTARLTSEEDEAAFLQSRLKLFIPRRPKETFDPYANAALTTRKFVVQGELLKLHLLIQRPELTTKTAPEGASEGFISDSFFSRMKWEVQFQTQKFDAKLHALQSLAKGKGKVSVTEPRPKHTFATVDELKGSSNGVPEPIINRLSTGDILYTMHIPIGIQEKYVSSKLTLILSLRPVAFPERCFSTLSDESLEQTAITSLEARSPIVRTVHTRVRLRQPLSVQFARQSVDSIHYITLTAENNWNSTSIDLPEAKDDESCLYLQDIWFQRDATKLLSAKKEADPKIDMHASTPNFEPMTARSSKPSAGAGSIRPLELIKVDFDKYFRFKTEKGNMPMKLSVGDHYASVMVIEVRPGAGEMGRPTGTMQSTFMVAWTSACLYTPILSRYDFQWPKPEAPSLLLSLNAPSPAPLRQVFPMHLTLSNFGSSKVSLELIVPSATAQSPSHPPLVDDIMSPASPRTATSPTASERRKLNKPLAPSFPSIPALALNAAQGQTVEQSSTSKDGPDASKPGTSGGRLREVSRRGGAGQHRRSSSLDNPLNPPRLLSQPVKTSAPSQPSSRPPPQELKNELPQNVQTDYASPLFCLQKTVKIGEVEAQSSVRVKLDYVAGREGVFELKPFVVIDTLTNHRFSLKHTPLVYVLPSPHVDLEARPTKRVS